MPIDEDHFNAKFIQYFENTYELLESAGEKGLTENTYLSKLILNRVEERDAGVYVCVGMNYRGFKMREAVLSIVKSDESNDEFSGHDLIYLFLIPIGLAMLPLMIWCFYVWLCKTKGGPNSLDNYPKDFSKIDVNRNTRYVEIGCV